jgi:hypothetical protein
MKKVKLTINVLLTVAMFLSPLPAFAQVESEAVGPEAGKLIITSFSFTYNSPEYDSLLWQTPNTLLITDLNYLTTIDESTPLNELLLSTASDSKGIIGEALFYPNPFRLSEGSELGYLLAQDMPVEVRVYDMRANEIFREFYPAGSNGGIGEVKGYNRIPFGSTSFNHYQLPMGVYFAVILSEEKVIGKTKFAIKP